MPTPVPEHFKVPKYPIPSRPEFVTLTQDWAGDILENRLWKGNRTLIPSHVNWWVGVLGRGEYDPHHQGMAFDLNGLLLDGQHRARAVQITGIPITVLIVPNVPRETFRSMDSGRSRRAWQFIKGQKGATHIAAAARYLMTLGDEPRLTVIRRDPSNPQVLEEVRRWDELTWHAERVARLSREMKIPAAPHLAVLAQAERTIYRDRVPPWLDSLETGAPERGYPYELADWRDDPRHRVRERFTTKRRMDLRGTAKATHAYNYLALGWNLHAQGLLVEGVFRWLPTQPHVDIIGYRHGFNPNAETKEGAV